MLNEKENINMSNQYNKTRNKIEFDNLDYSVKIHTLAITSPDVLLSKSEAKEYKYVKNVYFNDDTTMVTYEINPNKYDLTEDLDSLSKHNIVMGKFARN